MSGLLAKGGFRVVFRAAGASAASCVFSRLWCVSQCSGVSRELRVRRLLCVGGEFWVSYERCVGSTLSVSHKRGIST